VGGGPSLVLSMRAAASCCAGDAAGQRGRPALDGWQGPV